MSNDFFGLSYLGGKEWLTVYSFKENDLNHNDLKSIRSLIKENISSRELRSDCFQINIKSQESIETSIKTIITPALGEVKVCLCRPRQFKALFHEAVKEKQFKTALYLYSSGGGGHKAAMEALKSEHLKQLSSVCELFIRKLAHSLGTDESHAKKIFTGMFPTKERFLEFCVEEKLFDAKDVLHDYLGEVGVWASKQWDDAQKAGDVLKQEELASKQWMSDQAFGPTVFMRTLHTLRKMKPEKVVSTQAMATPSILLAVKCYNWFFKPSGRSDLQLELYMTDMPTKFSGHFFNSLKKNCRGKDRLKLYVPETTKSVQSLCNLKPEQVKMLKPLELPVRPAMLDAISNLKGSYDPAALKLKVSGKEELELLKSIVKGQAFKMLSNNMIEYKVNPEDKSLFIMLGSQPTESAIEEYIQAYAQKAQKEPKSMHHLFLYTGKFAQECFYKRLCEKLGNKALPANLQVVPLCFQDAENLVDLYLHCDTITRSGGSTCFELLIVRQIEERLIQNGHLTAPFQRLIHAQLVEGRSLIESIPAWERGNAIFLKNNISAQIVSPMTFKPPSA